MPKPTDSPRERRARWLAPVLPATAGLLFAIARARPDSGLAAWLSPAILLEAIVVHAGVLLGAALLFWPRTRRGHVAYWLVFGVLGALYLRAAFQLGGTTVAAQFVLLGLVTYGGVLWVPAPRRTAVGVETGVRWLIAVLLITVTFGVVGAPESAEAWTDVNSRLSAGAVYFALLAGVEATGLYVALRRIGAAGA
jgi:hypothetical protein